MNKHYGFEISKDTDCLILLTVGDFKESNVYTFFTKYFKNIITAKNINEASVLINSNYVDIILCDNQSSINAFECLRHAKEINEKILTFLATNSLNNKNLLESIELKLDGYLVENTPEDTLSKQINLPLSKYTQNKNNQLFGQYFNLANDHIIISKTDPNGIITYVNNKFCEISGYSRKELIGQSHNIIKNPENETIFFKDLWNTIKNKKSNWEGIIKNKNKNGDFYFVKAMIMPILDKNNDIVEYVAFKVNVSEVISDKNLLLTQIENNNLSVLTLLQIEKYDILEKCYSDEAINKIERDFGNSLLKNLPSPKIFKKVYFLGNGKYALLCDFYNCEKLDQTIEKYLKKFVKRVNKSAFFIDGIEEDLNIVLSYSFGKYMLYEDARQGLHEAAMVNEVVHYSNDASVREQLFAKENKKILKQVKTALDNDNIVSYFQPIINNQTKKIEKYESLVRLIDENNKVITPFHFLNISKESAYYTKITHRVLKNSFKVLEKTQADISINLSILDIENEETIKKLFSLLDTYKKYTHRIIFELLEDENVKNFKVIKKFIYKIKKRGVKIAIDDFGSGYSSFARLLDIAPDIIKIDGCLIRNIETDDFARNLVETIVVFAKKQNIKTVAEFVENEKVFTLLKNIGIDYSQGYFLGHPKILEIE